MLLDKRRQSVGVSALESVDDAFVLQKEKGWHSTNTVSLRDWLNAIDVNFEEYNASVLRCEPLEDGRNHLAWSAPCGVEVDDDELGASRIELSVKFDSGRDLFDHRDRAGSVSRSKML